MSMQAAATIANPARPFDPAAFERAYRDRILGNGFFEEPRYYTIQKPRYRNTLRLICGLPIAPGAEVLEIGGGQMALLCGRLFGDRVTVADVSDQYSASVTKHGIAFRTCDLLRDDLGETSRYDLVVMCEVVEHLPVPLHLVLEKVVRWIRPGGYLFLTTPNLTRLRNIVRLLRGEAIFCPLRYPEPGQPIGHPCEFSAPVLKWQMEQAGLADIQIRFEQLSYGGFSVATNLGRRLLAPLLLARPAFRDTLVAWGRRPESADPAGDGRIETMWTTRPQPPRAELSQAQP